ncbi:MULTISPECIES: hypothetical protein [unclassified Novosphingobium]|uniref:hypothetical protein n=1 Tax=unclassified Novosphingobium TaxID=2644732 RepID=UPI000AE8E24B|nr:MULTISPECIES: hypothetical protein [unclassified Novosphingobium]MBN9146188.1 hypothetical protein [Novosphingobium sp.]MDR6710118.1 hypothetical protein [Novosphingobium sp. 1748]NKI99914.1 hypothetical protein [Novosphingobium sp. SG707]
MNSSAAGLRVNGVVTMKLDLPLCLFNRHAPRRSRVKWDGLNFVGHCRFCEKPIRRMDKGRWVRDQIEKIKSSDL